MGSRPTWISVENLRALCEMVMERSGMPAEDAHVTADVLATAEAWGIHTHRTKQLRNLLKNFRDGKTVLRASTETLSEGVSFALLDGHRSNPMITAHFAMRTAVAKARSTEAGFCSVRDRGHFGACGYYANMAAETGMIGACMCNVPPGVAAPGSRGAVLGTNPLAYAVPAGNESTTLLVLATSVVAASKVHAARDAGTSIPNTWLVDGTGLPTTDPSEDPAAGALLPIGGHKGYGIALLIEILTGIISGGAFGSSLVSWLRGLTRQTSRPHLWRSTSELSCPLHSSRDALVS